MITIKNGIFTHFDFNAIKRSRIRLPILPKPLISTFFLFDEIEKDAGWLSIGIIGVFKVKVSVFG